MLPELVQNLIRVALAAAEGREPPKEFLIFGYGTIDTEKGTFQFTPEACDALLAERARHSAEVQIDYDHLAIKSEKPGDGKAAGWCNLEKRDDGLWAVNVRWTPPAAEMLRNGEYRYFSPYFAATKKEHLIVMLMNIAITNLPAMYEIEALVAASRCANLDLSALDLGTTVPPPPPPAPLPAPQQLVEVRVEGVSADIRKGSDGKFRLYDSDGQKLLGTHDTLEQAKAQESAINISKARKAGHHIPKKAKESRTMAGHKLGGYLAKHLKEKGLALKAFAEKAGMAEDRARALHDGEAPTPEEMNGLAKAFGLTGPDELEEQIDSWNGDASYDPAGDAPDERRIDAGPVATNRNRRPKKVADDADASAMLIGLTGEENLQDAGDKLQAVIEVAASVPQMRKELETLRKKNDQEARERIIRKGKEQGKLTPALIRMLAREPVEKAEQMLESLPVLSREQRDLRDAEPSEAAAILTTEEMELCRLTRESPKGLAEHVSKNGGARDQLGGVNADAILESYRAP